MRRVTEPKPDRMTANQARTRKEAAIARRRELELEALEGSLVRKDEVRASWRVIAAQVLAAFDRIAPKCAPAAAAAKDARGAAKAISAEVAKIKQELADALACD